MISVDINENDGHPVVVTSDSAFSFGGHSFPPGEAVRAALSGSAWTLSQARIVRPQLGTVATSSSTRWRSPQRRGLRPTRSASSPFASTVARFSPCRERSRPMTPPSGAVTLSTLPLEEYVRSVVSAGGHMVMGAVRRDEGSPQNEPWGVPGPRGPGGGHKVVRRSRNRPGGWSLTRRPVTLLSVLPGDGRRDAQ